MFFINVSSVVISGMISKVISGCDCVGDGDSSSKKWGELCVDACVYTMSVPTVLSVKSGSISSMQYSTLL